jgi:hypothetical protein
MSGRLPHVQHRSVFPKQSNLRSLIWRFATRLKVRTRAESSVGRDLTVSLHATAELAVEPLDDVGCPTRPFNSRLPVRSRRGPSTMELGRHSRAAGRAAPARFGRRSNSRAAGVPVHPRVPEDEPRRLEIMAPAKDPQLSTVEVPPSASGLMWSNWRWRVQPQVSPFANRPAGTDLGSTVHLANSRPVK